MKASIASKSRPGTTSPHMETERLKLCKFNPSHPLSKVAQSWPDQHTMRKSNETTNRATASGQGPQRTIRIGGKEEPTGEPRSPRQRARPPRMWLQAPSLGVANLLIPLAATGVAKFTGKRRGKKRRRTR
ncbi:hypothetical protein BJX65DRAFT_251601 [Aspergillus insuetus]